jgi:flagellar biosynthesis/type III secretory pathway M-ring protein FliF/YscJ
VVKQRENHLREKILSKLADIPGVQVAVTVDLDTSKRVTQKISHEAPQPKTEKSKVSETTAARLPSEPGTVANLGQAVSAGGTGQSNTNEETLVENYEPKVSQTETIEQMPFATKRVSAAVGIPRSFIAGIFKARHPDREPPTDDDADFVTIRDEQVSRVKTSVERIVMADDPDDVQVDVYPDMDWTTAGGGWSATPAGVVLAGGSGAELDSIDLLTNYGPQAGLAILALVSFIMMLRIAKSAAPQIQRSEGDVEEVPSGEEPLLTVGPYPVGQAERSDSLLTGQEVDGEALRFQELGEEVSSLIKEDPEGTAHLIRRWIEEK